jgi:starch phosphorylase
VSAIDPFLSRTHIAYFSMEIAVRSEMHSYAGGLGILAGDTARSCAGLELPVVFVTLASRAGYFLQEIDAEGRQTERPDRWEPQQWCTALGAMVVVEIEGNSVWIRPWLYIHKAVHGYGVPILLLDTDLEQNREPDRRLTDQLYGGDDEYRLKQEIVLGIGGIRILQALGFELHTYHLNEGHAALLALELLNRWRVPEEERIAAESLYDIAEVRQRCVFTTHTPVEAGHDRFAYDLFERLLPGFIDLDVLQELAGADRLNMTRLALNLADYVNGVARRHAQTTEHMFPGYRIHAVTNGVNVDTWMHAAFTRLYDKYTPYWLHEPELLLRVLQLPGDEIWNCHLAARSDLSEYVKKVTGAAFDPALPVLGFARRMTGYKRPLLLFEDLDRLAAIAAKHPFQLVMAGKAHPDDMEGKEAIRQLHQDFARLKGRIRCVFLPNYDMDIAKLMVAGCEVWLNTPLPPFEASGTSGMKAALNGVLNLSVLDGWWIEACIEGVTGWAIGADGPADEKASAAALYDKLERVVLPLYHEDPAGWRQMMKQSIGYIGSHFNSHRMMRRYATEAYLR